MGVDPTEKNFYYPYYQGEFTPEGHLKNDQDPYLYWVIPIVKTHDPAAFRAGRLRLDQPEPETDLQIVDLLEEHVLLPTESSADPKLEPIPGARLHRVRKKARRWAHCVKSGFRA